jgi:hypothetical protein
MHAQVGHGNRSGRLSVSVSFMIFPFFRYFLMHSISLTSCRLGDSCAAASRLSTGTSRSSNGDAGGNTPLRETGLSS